MVDRLGSVVRRNTDQAPYQTLRFYPFGEIQSGANDSTNREKFATYFRDGASSLDYAQNRYYSSRQGRFLTPDPFAGSANMRDPRSWNKYAYAGNDPVNNLDPQGTRWILASSSCYQMDF